MGSLPRAQMRDVWLSECNGVNVMSIACVDLEIKSLSASPVYEGWIDVSLGRILINWCCYPALYVLCGCVGAMLCVG